MVEPNQVLRYKEKRPNLTMGTRNPRSARAYPGQGKQCPTGAMKQGSEHRVDPNRLGKGNPKVNVHSLEGLRSHEVVHAAMHAAMHARSQGDSDKTCIIL